MSAVMNLPVDSPILHLKDFGQSVWMDNLSRNLLTSGELNTLISQRDVHGITSNPAIFEKAIAGNAIYDADIEAGIRAGQSVEQIYESLVFADIQKACDILLPVYEASQGQDGYVSLEVPPSLADDAQGTLQEARRYAQAIQRPNLMIKIPGTTAGFQAVEAAIRDGLSVNVTLLFSQQSYVETAWAYIRGLEARLADGHAIDSISSVASFFLSRIDSKIDGMVDDLIAQTDDESLQEKLLQVKGKVAIANAKLAYQAYKTITQSDRWQQLVNHGARPQRLLWASTSTKNPNYSDVMYVDELIGPDTVNTLPPQTIEACADHCDVANRIETNLTEAQDLIASLADLGINLDQVMDELLLDGIDKFIQPFDQLMNSLVLKVKQLATV